MEIVLAVMLAVVIVLLIILLLRKPALPSSEELNGPIRLELQQQLSALRQETAVNIKNAGDNNINATAKMGSLLHNYETQAEQNQARQLQDMDRKLNEQMQALQQSTAAQLLQLEKRMETLEKAVNDRLEAMRSSTAEQLQQLQNENSRKLEEIRGTVDEKLQTTLEKRISESFKAVNEQLEQVYRGIGEMQSLAGDVGSLKKVLSGVKTRGILGEIQLGSILEEILAPEQYDTNVATVPGSSERVEYAVKLPGAGGTVYLPIDSKFPGDRYAALTDAQEAGDREAAEAAWKLLEAELKKEAQDIRSKYVAVPHTTNFGIMFLPFEGLYAEAVSRGMLETLQQNYQISIAGPSTMAALLNSLQMGFRTLAIQKRSNEVWKVLSSVKTEFDKFEGVLTKMQSHLNQTSTDLEALMGTRTRAIQRKLRDVSLAEDSELAEGTDSFREVLEHGSDENY